MPTYITNLISLASNVCMEDRSSPHTLVQLLRRYRLEIARELTQARSWGSDKDETIIGYRRALCLDIAEIDRAIIKVKHKISVRGF